MKIGSSTVRRRLNESGLFYLPPLVKPLLTPNFREKGLQLAKEMKDMDWDQVPFTDETSIELFMAPSWVWGRKGEEVTVLTMKQP